MLAVSLSARAFGLEDGPVAMLVAIYSLGAM